MIERAASPKTSYQQQSQYSDQPFFLSFFLSFLLSWNIKRFAAVTARIVILTHFTLRKKLHFSHTRNAVAIRMDVLNERSASGALNVVA